MGRDKTVFGRSRGLVRDKTVIGRNRGLLDRQERTARDTLLQGVELPLQIRVAKPSLPDPKGFPTAHVEHGHAVIDFQVPKMLRVPSQQLQSHSLRTETCMAELVASGEPPIKCLSKDGYNYQCKLCSQSKNKLTGHTQIK
ncbi:uncharacterized protein LOC107550521, partial [Tachysurus ichikawai]